MTRHSADPAKVESCTNCQKLLNKKQCTNEIAITTATERLFHGATRAIRRLLELL